MSTLIHESLGPDQDLLDGGLSLKESLSQLQELGNQYWNEIKDVSWFAGQVIIGAARNPKVIGVLGLGALYALGKVDNVFADGQHGIHGGHTSDHAGDLHSSLHSASSDSSLNSPIHWLDDHMKIDESTFLVGDPLESKFALATFDHYAPTLGMLTGVDSIVPNPDIVTNQGVMNAATETILAILPTTVPADIVISVLDVNAAGGDRIAEENGILHNEMTARPSSPRKLALATVSSELHFLISAISEDQTGVAIDPKNAVPQDGGSSLFDVDALVLTLTKEQHATLAGGGDAAKDLLRQLGGESKDDAFNAMIVAHNTGLNVVSGDTVGESNDVPALSVEAVAPTMTLLNELGVTVGADGIVELKMDGDAVVIIEKSTSEEVGRDGLLTLDFMHEVLSRSGRVGGLQEPANPRSSRINQPKVGGPVDSYSFKLAADFRELNIRETGVDPWGGNIDNGRIERLLVKDDYWILAAGSLEDGEVVYRYVVFRPKNDENSVKIYPILPHEGKVDRIWSDNQNPS